MRRPDFFIVGAPRSGTTSLYAYLGQHPQIFMSPIKEPKFFAEDIFGDARAVTTMDQYLRCFERATDHKRVGEASTCYLGSKTAAIDIKAFRPDARIIIMLRNPVDVMYASHSGRAFDCQERVLNFEDALAADNDRELGLARWGGRRAPQLRYKDLVKYTQQVKRYLDLFGPQGVHIIIYEDFRSNTAGCYEETLRFLNVDANHMAAFPILNSNVRARNIVVQRLMAHPPAAIRRLVHKFTTLEGRRLFGRWISLLNVSQEQRPAMNPELRSRLLREFEAEICDLGRLIGRDLSMWLQGMR